MKKRTDHRQTSYRMTFLVMLLSAALLTGCGSAKSSSADYAAPAAAMEESAVTGSGAGGVYMYKAEYDTAEETVEEAAEEPQAAPGVDEEGIREVDTRRKLIRRVDLSVETQDIDALDLSIKQRAESLGGYIESSYMDGKRDVLDADHDGYDDLTGASINKNRRGASYTVRIPAEKLDLFVEAVTAASNVTSQSMNVEDITSSYVDIDSRRKALEQEQKRLLEMMDLAETVEEMIQIEDHLADVRYELENIGSQLRSYDNRVAYSTVYLNVTEVVEYTPLVQEGAFTRMTKGFAQSLADLLHGLKEFAVWFVAHLPYLVFWGLVIALIIWLIRRRGRSPEAAARREAARVRRQQKKAAKMAGKEARAKKNAPEQQNNNPEA